MIQKRDTRTAKHLFIDKSPDVEDSAAAPPLRSGARARPPPLRPPTLQLKHARNHQYGNRLLDFQKANRTSALETSEGLGGGEGGGAAPAGSASGKKKKAVKIWSLLLLFHAVNIPGR